MSKPPYAEDRTYGGVRGSGETIVSHSLLDLESSLRIEEHFLKLPSVKPYNASQRFFNYYSFSGFVDIYLFEDRK